MSGRPGALQRVPGLAGLARAQGGALSRTQLRTLGVDERAVAHQLRGERWQAVGPNVVATATGDLGVEARRWAALLSTPEPRALAAWTALEVRGLRRWERDAVHLVVPRGARPAPLPFVEVHESRRFASAHVGRCGGLDVTSTERSAVDAAAWAASGRGAGGCSPQRCSSASPRRTGCSRRSAALAR